MGKKAIIRAEEDERALQEIIDSILSYKTMRWRNSHVKYNDIVDIILTFDIEATYIAEIDESIMYIWMFSIDGTIVYGRTWECFVKMIEALVELCEANERMLFIYVHNLSYEWQYLRTIFDDKIEVFLTKPRKVLYFRYKNVLEFRCSYFLSNMSLDAWTHRLNVLHAKLSGAEFDYDKTRYPWTLLDDKELEYCFNDVLGLSECIEITLSLNEDTLATIPYTSTGYVRRDVKNAMKPLTNYVNSLKLDKHTYELCRRAFRGGNTHANRYYVGRCLEHVRSYDRDSSYPDVQLNGLFPISPFENRGSISVHEMDRLLSHEKAFIVDIVFIDIRQRDIYYGCPYLSLSKCDEVVDAVCDNGRVLEARHLRTVLTDVDFKIVAKQYLFDNILILDCITSSYGSLPKEFKSVIIDYYRKKTSLKGIKGEELYYMKSKNKLNSIYGLSAQDPVRDKVIVDNLEYKTIEADIVVELSKKIFFPYQWGVWTTALARKKLDYGIELAGDSFVYCDTDSVKCLDDIDFTSFNRECVEADMINSAYAYDSKGTRYNTGVFEFEEAYDRFITWGAKRYVAEVDSQLLVTVSGVNKVKAPEELSSLGGIEAFKPGLIFRDAGGMTITYNDHSKKIITIDGINVICTSNANIRPSTYRLGVTSEYEKILIDCGLPIDIFNEL